MTHTPAFIFQYFPRLVAVFVSFPPALAHFTSEFVESFGSKLSFKN